MLIQMYISTCKESLYKNIFKASLDHKGKDDKHFINDIPTLKNSFACLYLWNGAMPFCLIKTYTFCLQPLLTGDETTNKHSRWTTFQCGSAGREEYKLTDYKHIYKSIFEKSLLTNKCLHEI